MSTTGDDQVGPSLWGLGPGKRVWVGGHFAAGKRAVEASVVGSERPPTGAVDAAFVVPLTVDEALYFAGKIGPRLASGGRIWLVSAGPQPASNREGVECFQGFREHMARAGFLACGHIAIDDAFVAAGFRKRPPASDTPAC